MHLQIDNCFLAMPDLTGRELLTELMSAPWGNPVFKSIDGFGVAFGTHTGSRRSRNEDRMLVAKITSLGQEQFTVAMVCDGVGGSEMGDMAATLAVALFLSELSRISSPHPLSTILTEIIQKVDDGVKSALGGRGTTTASIVLASSTGEFAATNIGDSRIFSWKPGGSLKQVSVDDTIENELRGLVVLDPSALDARGLRGSLSQAIGEVGRSVSDLQVHLFNKDQFLDGVILASDGAWKSDEAGFGLIMQHSKSAADAVRRSMAFASWTGGVDNVSVIAIEDLLTFAKIGEAPEASVQLLPQTACVKAWVCDTKLVICESPRKISNTKSQVEKKTGQEKSSTRKNGAERKTRSRRPPVKSHSNQDEKQISLMEGEKNNRRTKIEISTDDNEEQETK